MTHSKKFFWIFINICWFFSAFILGQPQTNPHGSLNRECQECHTTGSWKIDKPIEGFDHPGFELSGAHKQIGCAECHLSLEFNQVGPNCSSCHQDVHQGQLGNDCSQCHQSQSWENRQIMLENHASTLFPLEGAHRILDCQSCHNTAVKSEFSLTPVDCQQCHLPAFQKTTNPNHASAGFTKDCQACHFINQVSWNQAKYNHKTIQLDGAHLQLDCASCHSAGYQGTTQDCYSCHQSDYEMVANPSHTQNQFPVDCTLCHNTNAWQPASFDHDQNGFPLTGAHRTLECSQCHQSGYQGTPTDCWSCHQNDFTSVEEPNHINNNFDHDCTVCHTTNAWQPASFDHNQTAFPLTGAHLPLDCVACHDQGYTNTPTDCWSCHQTDFNAVEEPNHITNNFDHDCTVCHTTNAWEPATFDHNQTAFPLTGAHVPLDCISCHDQGYQNTPTDCWSCHQPDFNAVEEPNHITNNFDHDCTICHTTNAWEPATFDHNQTAFPLTGAHVPLDCISCHDQGYQNTPTDCWSCHQPDFNAVDDPSHVNNNFDHDCTVCHTTNAWEPASFDHNQTAFPLTGAHVPLDCVACHDQGYQNTPTDCWSCHQPDFNAVDEPNHINNNFDHDCTVCHTTNAWEPASFDHNQTAFPLTGAHMPLDCISCHDQGYQNTPSDCWSCHQPDFNGVDDPSHINNNFDHDCTVCHTTNAWEPASFDHNQTAFPLTGAHMPLDCVACHDQGYQNTPSDCWSCHQPDFNGVDDPNHINNNFDHDCTVCHTTNAWEPASFDHNQTAFPLTGAHMPLDCVACHDQGYQNTPTDCWSCHQPDFNGVDDPSHINNNFDHDCTVCHTTNAWEPASFDHNQTAFPLTGAHMPLDCVACHDQGYQNTPADCWSCHQGDFNGVDDPSHINNNFDHDCTVCHTTNAWEPATFDHNQSSFPLTGAHRPLDCLACHKQGYQNTPADCWSCHQSDFNDVDDPNHIINNFDHDCTVCHTTNAWEPATFDHNQSSFPLSGAHSSLSCVECHNQGYQGTSAQCYSCHRSDFQNANDPDHVAASFPTDCATCHTTRAWEPANFDHAFPIYTGKHRGEWNRCTDCHAGGNYATFQCTTACHTQSAMDRKHEGRRGYTYSSPACYNCHPTGRE